jgi:transcriptional regulator of arginine metabolism
MISARKRRELMLAIVTSTKVATQDELAAALRRRGFDVSQASVSRDIAALGLLKAHGRYVRRASAAPDDDPALARIRDNVLGIRAAGEHLLVLGTPPGEASPVALALDRQGWPGVVGTIAGDDTIFVALTGADAARELRRRLRKIGVKG